MDIEGARALKAQLEGQILAAIRCFEKETGLMVEDVGLIHCRTLGESSQTVAAVEVEVQV